MRSEADLHSLRSLLRIEAIHSQLASFAPSMVLDRVRTDTVGPEGGGFCLPATDKGATGERIRHHFELRSRGAESSRIYFVDYVTCKKGPSLYTAEMEAQGFASRFAPAGDPVVTSAMELKILSLALDDPGVSGAMIEALRRRSLAYLTITALGSDSGLEFFLVVAADGVPGGPDTSIEIRYEASYHPGSGEVVFSVHQ